VNNAAYEGRFPTGCWKGYGVEHNSLEPESNVVNAPEIVADYWKRQAEKQAGLGALLQT
jgi:hypothetical protein